MQRIKKAVNVLCTEASELHINSTVTELHATPDALEFARTYYAKNQPLVVRGGVSHWPAVSKWSTEFLLRAIGDKLVEVAVTPNGYADGLAEYNGHTYFMLPHNDKITVGSFLQHLDDPTGPVYYIQKQNSNFHEDFQELANDIDTTILTFAEQSFNKQPDAVNFWMGDERAITSMHKDPYDNLYCVISGYKDFILLPPYEVANIPRKRYRTGEFKQDACGQFYCSPVETVKADTGVVKPIRTEWISIDPLQPNLRKFPQYCRARPLHVRVNAGDLFYMPSFWYHHVRQSHRCIAVNFWYDMDFDDRYCYYRMLEKLSTKSRKKHIKGK